MNNELELPFTGIAQNFGFFVLVRFFSEKSSFVHGGIEKLGEEQPPVVGQNVRRFIFQPYSILFCRHVWLCSARHSMAAVHYFAVD